MPNPDELLAVVRRYYPPGLSNDDPRYLTSQETQRRNAALRQASGARASFTELIRKLQERHPERYVADETMLSYDPCLRVRMSTHAHDPAGTRWTFVVGCVSILAPVYMVYISETWAVGKGVESRVTYDTASGTAPAFTELCEELERVFGAKRVPPEIGLMVVPDVQTGNIELGSATIYDCIFTPDRR